MREALRHPAVGSLLLAMLVSSFWYRSTVWVGGHACTDDLVRISYGVQTFSYGSWSVVQDRGYVQRVQTAPTDRGPWRAVAVVQRHEGMLAVRPADVGDGLVRVQHRDWRTTSSAAMYPHVPC